MKKILAFSLIELMISLITISCITAAFAPIITKKMKNSNVSVALSEISTKCDKFTSECSLCYSSKCVACSRYCNDNQYKNVGTCLCENCVDRSVGCIRCDAKECKKCDLGYGLTSDGKCRLCPAGYYSDGTYDCKACPVGQYQNAQGKSSCIACPAGQYQNAEGKTSCIACPTGQYQNEQGKAGCKLCPTGQYQNATGQSSCKSCWAGTYQNQQGKTSCTNCWAGSWSDANASTCYACSAGWACNGAGTATKCSAGYYAPAGSSGCSACWAGTYSGAGASGCTSCWAGSYSGAGASTCIGCWAGSYSNAGASGCTACSSTWANCTACTVNGCTACANGYIPNGSGGCKKAGPSQADCDAIGPELLFIPAEKNGGSPVCVTKYNVSRIHYGINTSLNYHKTGEGGGDHGRICWEIQTDWYTGPCTTLTAYSGCNRVVCDKDAAAAICPAMNYGGKTWRLPKLSEMYGWDQSVLQGLRACTDQTSVSHLYDICKGFNQGCFSRYGNYCAPYLIHGSDGFLQLGVSAGFGAWTGVSASYGSWGFSVRCVTVLTNY